MSSKSDWAGQDRDLYQTQVDLAHLERREWWSWGAALTIIAFLTVTVAVLCLSSVSDQLLTQTQRELVLRGLVPLVLLFAFFTIRQQSQIGRLRRQLATQIAMTATMEYCERRQPRSRRGGRIVGTVHGTSSTNASKSTPGRRRSTDEQEILARREWA